MASSDEEDLQRVIDDPFNGVSDDLKRVIMQNRDKSETNQIAQQSLRLLQAINDSKTPCKLIDLFFREYNFNLDDEKALKLYTDTATEQIRINPKDAELCIKRGEKLKEQRNKLAQHQEARRLADLENQRQKKEAELSQKIRNLANRPLDVGAPPGRSISPTLRDLIKKADAEVAQAAQAAKAAKAAQAAKELDQTSTGASSGSAAQRKRDKQRLINLAKQEERRAQAADLQRRTAKALKIFKDAQSLGSGGTRTRRNKTDGKRNCRRKTKCKRNCRRNKTDCKRNCRTRRR